MSQFQIPAVSAQVGGDILGLITSGMYGTPLAVVREYVQNAADAYESVGIYDGKLDINVDPARMRLTILDFGPGLTSRGALRALLPVASSEKTVERNRGFRGIGRLSGLAFADSVRFVTCAKGEAEATQVTWDGASLRRNIAQGMDAPNAIERSVSWGPTDETEDLESFLRVEISGIARHAAPELLNREKVRQYISEVCPVPFAATCSLGSDIRRHVRREESLCELRIYLNADEQPVARTLTDSFKVSEAREDACRGLEFLDLPNIDGTGSVAIGWIAHSSYLGAIHKAAGIRGIRARAGNIQIGDESVFDALFEEERFNRWCIGEIHLTDKRVIPNARRDYFEPSPHLRNLESKLAVRFKKLSAHCRRASMARNRNKRIVNELSLLRESYRLAASGYLPQRVTLAICSKAAKGTEKLRRLLSSIEEENMELSSLLDSIEQEFLAFRSELEEGEVLGFADRRVLQLQPIFGTVAERLNSPSEAMRLIELIMEDLSDQGLVEIDGGPELPQHESRVRPE